MSKDILRDRESALEYEFFHKVDVQLWSKLKENLKLQEQEKALADATGIADESVLHELVELGINNDTLFAFSLFPLIWVAWADGEIQPQERKAILEAAHSTGHGRDTASHHLIDTWLDHEPSEAIHQAWKDYVHAICEAATPELKATLKQNALKRSRKVAQAAGGILGLHKISREEEAVLKEIEATFDS